MKRFSPEGRLIEKVENKKALCSQINLDDARSREQIIEAHAVICDTAHNLIVDLGCMKGVIPREEGAIGIREGIIRDIAIISRVGKPVSFIIKSIETDAAGNPFALLSRRKAQEQCLCEYISNFISGDVIDVRVTHLEPFGAFCDIGCGISSLLPIDAMSVSRISHPRDRLMTGDDIKAVVKGIENGRVTLSLKELLGTWEENAEIFAQGETVSGVIRSIEEYGVFVELAPNLAGLAEPKDGVIPGRKASVYIKSIIPEKMKVKLIIVDSFTDNYGPPPLKYFYNGLYLDKWVYSPNCASKVIETVF